MPDTADLARDERLALIELLRSLGDADWDTPSLCQGWTVRDVAAHLAYASALSPLQAVAGLARSGFRVNRFIHDSARRWSARGRDAILDQLTRNAERGTSPIGMPPAAVVTDAVVHQLDVRRPLHRPRQVPPDAFRTTADFLVGAGAKAPTSMMLGGTLKRRITGLTVVATDVDWRHGSGPEVRAGAETLLLVLAGRPVEADEVTGAGAATLLGRL